MRKRSEQGSGLVEALSIGVFLVVIAIALIDLVVTVLANGVNDTAAKNAARAAANQPSGKEAYQAAQNSVQNSKTSSFITSLILQSVDYTNDDIVTCKTRMELKLPVPLPGVGGNIVFMAEDTEPIVK